MLHRPITIARYSTQMQTFFCLHFFQANNTYVLFSLETGTGLLLSMSLPVILANGEFVGVVGMDFKMTELQSIVCVNH